MKNSLIPPVSPGAEWEEFELPFSIGSGRSFFPTDEGTALRMAFFRSRKDDSLVGKVWFGEGIEGPPGHVHGGVSAYVLDEAMGSACWLSQYPCVASKIEFELQRMTPIGQDLDISASITKVEGRIVHVTSKIFDQDGIYTKGTGQFFIIDRKTLEDLLIENPQNLDLDALKFV